MVKRTFGWVQNPSNFDNLRKTVQIFIKHSAHHQYLTKVLSNYSIIKDTQLADQLLDSLNENTLELTYKDLVGTGTSKRSEAPCDALVQASIPPQSKKKNYVDNWTSDGFVRWAECLGFIQYSIQNDSFTITSLGIKFGESQPDDHRYLLEGLLQYPPVYKVLSILNEDPLKSYSKFEIGSELGFIGEPGFTSLTHNVIMTHLKSETDRDEVKKIRQDREGSSDKYARMISGWLLKVGLVRKSPIDIYNKNLDSIISFGHAYQISSKGVRALSKIKGNSKHKRVEQYASWYMLATNAKNRDYLRTRRSLLLKFLKSSAKGVSVNEITDYMAKKGFKHNSSIFKKDINGLRNCGFSINITLNKYTLESKIIDFDIPTNTSTKVLKNKDLEVKKEKYLELYPDIDPKYVELIEISRLKSQSLIFEAQVVDILTNEYNIASVHLGGPSKPDGLSYYTDPLLNFGLIIDTKAYKDGFSLNANEKDKMIRYIEDNNKRNPNINNTKWWEEFPAIIDNFNFLFVSSFFGPNIENGLQYINLRSNCNGGALEVDELLKGAQMCKSGSLQISDIPSFLQNSIVKF